MHLTLQQLRLFEAVSRNNSFTRAAEELHLTQPAVSIQIKRLESHVGLPLFEKVGKKLYPTPAGQAVYQTSREILRSIAALEQSLHDLKGSVRGALRLSVVTTAKYFLPHLIGQFLRLYPEVDPSLKFTNRARIMDRLLNNEDDFVIMGQIPPGKGLVAHPFLENVIVPVAAPDHPLAAKKRLPLEELVSARVLAREEGSGTRIAFEKLLEAKNLTVEPYMELGSAEAIKQGVMAGLGVAIISLHALQLEISTQKLVILDVEGFPIKRRWYAVHHQDKTLSITARTFLDFILETGRQPSDSRQSG
ncbi:MAG TPA: LysR family transcriptional regulator [Chromatiaceae bacterium]|nr:LysR family transcriptional regulator [Chromatiaceae bacterium]